MLRTIILIVTLSFFSLILGAQNKIIEGYVFETGNRGYINQVKVMLKSDINDEVIDTDFTTKEGFFSFEVDEIQNYTVSILKDMYESQDLAVPASELRAKDKVFLSMKMARSPGYQFEITLAPKREEDGAPVDAINGALIEVFNNTTREPVMVLKDHPDPHFDVDLIKGNHYTILVRKEGYLAKRMEAFVDVEGCILCFEGIGSVTPGVADNLTGENQMGVLLANVELERVYSGKKMEVRDIYYDYGSAKLRKEAFEELDKVAVLIKDNPEITIELGSHTDARGKAAKNQVLSLERAESAVRYLIEEGGVPTANIIARGYGESNIKNGCVDGVDCSEAKHQENRRTELKVTGIMASPPEPLSLERMKGIENMDDIIAELQNEGQLKLEEGQSIDDIIKKTEKPTAVSKEETPKPAEEDVNKAIDQIFAQAESTMENETAEVEKEAARTSLDDGMKEVGDAITKVSEEVTKVSEVSGEITEVSQEVTKVSQEVTKVIEAVNGAATTPEESSNPYSYIDGPKIVIMESSEMLQSDHPIFSKHEQIYQYLQGDKVLYMIGNFEEEIKAEGFLRTTKMMYPDAYLLKFDKGTIVD